MGKDPHRYVEELADNLHAAGMNFDVAAKRCRAYRKRLLDLSQQHKALHLAPAFSCLEIVDTIYHGLMRPNDTFVMSKGHGCLAQYVILEELGYFNLEGYCKASILGAHPDYGVPGIACSTGSLGHGLGIAVGLACADRLLGHKRRIFVVLSDGEMYAGPIWEAMHIAQSLGLTEITAFVDCNDIGGLEKLDNSSLLRRISAFGWQKAHVDGHDHRAIYNQAMGRQNLTMLYCETIKGKGVSFMEHDPIWHYRSPNPEEFQQAALELGQ